MKSYKPLTQPSDTNLNTLPGFTCTVRRVVDVSAWLTAHNVCPHSLCVMLTSLVHPYNVPRTLTGDLTRLCNVHVTALAAQSQYVWPTALQKSGEDMPMTRHAFLTSTPKSGIIWKECRAGHTSCEQQKCSFRESNPGNTAHSQPLLRVRYEKAPAG